MYVCMCMYVNMYACVCKNVPRAKFNEPTTYIYMSCMHPHACMGAWGGGGMYGGGEVCMYVCMEVCIYACMYVTIYSPMYVICMHAK